MIIEYTLSAKKQYFYDITREVRDAISKSGVKSGIAVVYCPHTTAGITINESADPDVIHDLLLSLEKAFPESNRFRHAEGNSTAHIKASAMGSSETIITQNGKPVLGMWQNIYFCEFDPPRNRKFYVKILSDG